LQVCWKTNEWFSFQDNKDEIFDLQEYFLYVMVGIRLAKL